MGGETSVKIIRVGALWMSSWDPPYKRNSVNCKLILPEERISTMEDLVFVWL